MTELRIESGNLKVGDKIEIYDVTVKLQSFSIVNSPLSIIDVSSLSSGVYFVKIGNSNGKFIKK
ncbi:MAG: T9SS type A sorting domain-containing protein [Prevotellaceae bacterium]|nr:T9SS type A sorting domain-containing protein [Prevotellaceae bacterium]